MKPQDQPPTQWSRSTTRSFLIWFSRWQVLRWFVFSMAGVITFVALVYAIVNWRGGRALDNYRRVLKARGDKLDLQAFVPAEVPDEANFAMTPFLAPLFDFVPNPKPGENLWRDTNGFARATGFAKELPSRAYELGWRKGNKTDLTKWLAVVLEAKNRTRDPASTSQDPEASREGAVVAAAVLAVIKPYEPILEELRVASRRPNSRFNIRYDQENPYAILIPHLAVIKGVCQMLKTRAVAKLAFGETEQAFADVQLMLYLVDSVKDEPMLISYLVRMANLQIAIQAIWEGLAEHRWSETQLEQLQARLQQFNWVRDSEQTLRGERAFGFRLAQLLRQSPNRWRSEELTHPCSERVIHPVRW